MSSFLNQQLTDVGWDALSTALGGGRLTFFKMQAGDGTILNDSDIPPMTGLVHPICDIGITKYAIEGDGQITIWGNISSAQLDVGFTFRELGIFAAIENPVAGAGVPAGANISVIGSTPETRANPVVPNPPLGTPLMYSYCNSYTTSDYIPGSGETTDVVNTIQVTIKIDKAVNPVVNITVGTTLEINNIGPSTVGAGPWSYTASNIAWLKRIVQGPGLVITEDANTITFQTKVLTVDLDLYVAIGNPDVAPNFSTIQNALNWLRDYYIPTNIFATIHVQSGLWTNSATIIVDHPQGLQIKIIGTATGPLAVTNATATGGKSVRLNAPAGRFSGIAVNDFIYYDNTTNQPSMAISGIQQVTAVAGDGSSITYDTGFAPALPSMSSVTGGNVYWLKSVIDFPVNTNGVFVQNQGLGLFRYIVLRGHVATTNVVVGLQASRGTSYLEYVGAYGFDGTATGGPGVGTIGSTCGFVAFYSGAVYLTNCAANKCFNGFYGGNAGAYMNARYCYANSNKNTGIFADGGALRGFFCGAMGNASIGVGSSGGSVIVPDQFYGSYNVAYGIHCQFHSHCQVSHTSGGIYSNNGTRDIQISYLSSIIRTGPTAIVYGSSNIAPNTLSWDGCIFVP